MVDHVRRLSDELVRDPGSRVFVPLGEALRRRGQLDLALKVTLRGLERHPHFADAHDLLARIAVDRGDLERAFDEWDMVLRLVPGHLGALTGMVVDRVRDRGGRRGDDAVDQRRAARAGHLARDAARARASPARQVRRTGAPLAGRTAVSARPFSSILDTLTRQRWVTAALVVS